TDIYAMGVILYEALAGRTPYSADSIPALYVQIATGQRQPLEAARPDIPRSLAAIVERAMATDRRQRFQTAAEMRAALLGFLAEGSGAATPAAPGATPRRAPGMRLLVGAGIVLLGVGAWAGVRHAVSGHGS